MQHKDEPVGKRALARPAGEPGSCMIPAAIESGSRRDRVRRRDPEKERLWRMIATVPTSKRPKGLGMRPGLPRASQLRVKLGTTRPPISVISRMTAATPARTEKSALPRKCASR